MTPIKMQSFVDELTKMAKPNKMGTLLGQNVTATVKRSAKKALTKKAGRMDAAKALASKVGKKMSAGYTAVGKTIRKHPKKSIAAGAGIGAGAALLSSRSSKRK